MTSGSYQLDFLIRNILYIESGTLALLDVSYYKALMTVT